MIELAPECTAIEREMLTMVLEKVWDRYFPLGEQLDLANHIAYLFYMLTDYRRALTFYRHSEKQYGTNPDGLYSQALCHSMLEQAAAACSLLEQILLLDAQHEEAKVLLQQCREKLLADTAQLSGK